MSAAYDLFQQGRNHLRSGMPAQATVALEKAKRLEPEKASIREALGIAYFRIRRWSEAEAEFRKVLELSPAEVAYGQTLEVQGTDLKGDTTTLLISHMDFPEPVEADAAWNLVTSPDIRAGMALILAALCARGESVIENAQMIDRGYEAIEEKLRGLGADIVREG